MLNKKLESISESKLSKALTQITEGKSIEKTGFLKSSNKSSLFKTKSFRLREADFINLSNITSKINNKRDIKKRLLVILNYIRKQIKYNNKYTNKKNYGKQRLEIIKNPSRPPRQKKNLCTNIQNKKFNLHLPIIVSSKNKSNADNLYIIKIYAQI